MTEHMDRGSVELITNARRPGSSELVDVWISAAAPFRGRITAVTPAGEVTEHAGQRATGLRALDAAGRTLTSGLWDEHVHLGQWAQQASRPDFYECASPEAALEQVAQHIAELRLASQSDSSAPRELIGMRLRGSDWGGLTREQLDAASGEVPVVLMGIDLHGAWLNSAALARFGFAPDHAAHVVEDECFALSAHLDRIPESELDRRVASVSRAAAALGVVGIVDFEMRWGIDDWERRDARGLAPLRVESSIYPQFLARALDLGLRTGDPIGTGGLATVGPVKLITDGSLGTRTAWCCEPYPDGGHGRELIAPAELVDFLTRAHAGGLTCAVHAIGDRANAQALDAFAATGAEGRIEHAQLLRRADLARFAALGVAASVQPAHLLDDVPAMSEVWAERAQDAFPLASLLASGAEVVFGSDAPVAPLDPWLAIRAAVTRAPEDASPWVPSEQLSLAQALACSMRGPLRPGVGDVADLMLLEHDPLGHDPLRQDPHHQEPPHAAQGGANTEQLRLPEVAATFVGGHASYLGPTLT